jgi:PAS domain-containing protein
MLDRFSASNAAGVTGGSENSSGPRNLWFWWQLGNPNEPIVVTQTLSQPVLIEDTYDTRESDPAFVGLSYAGASTPQWQIVNEDGTDVPGTASFNTWGRPQLTPLPYRWDRRPHQFNIAIFLPRCGLLVLEPDLTIRFANRSFCHTFEVAPEETVGQKLYELGNGQWDIPKLRTALETIISGRTTPAGVAWKAGLGCF